MSVLCICICTSRIFSHRKYSYSPFAHRMNRYISPLNCDGITLNIMRATQTHTHTIQRWKFISGNFPSVAAIRCIYLVAVVVFVHLYKCMYVYQSVCTRLVCAHATKSEKSRNVVQTIWHELMFGVRAHLSMSWILNIANGNLMAFCNNKKNRFDSSNPILWLAYLSRQCLPLMFWLDLSFCTSNFTENTLLPT